MKINTKTNILTNLINIKKDFLYFNFIKIGNIIKVGYIIPEGLKDRIQYYEGLIIAKTNKNFTLRYCLAGIIIEHIFFIFSPKIIFITKKQSFKIRRSKLYFLRFLNIKSFNFKSKF